MTFKRCCALTLRAISLLPFIISIFFRATFLTARELLPSTLHVRRKFVLRRRDVGNFCNFYLSLVGAR